MLLKWSSTLFYNIDWIVQSFIFIFVLCFTILIAFYLGLLKSYFLLYGILLFWRNTLFQFFYWNNLTVFIFLNFASIINFTSTDILKSFLRWFITCQYLSCRLFGHFLSSYCCEMFFVVSLKTPIRVSVNFLFQFAFKMLYL